MAEVFPFRALRYNPSAARLAEVVTQPYDKITPHMQEGYYSASPYNLVRIILGKAGPADGEDNNVYTRAAEYLRAWKDQGVLAADRDPSIYLYSQRFPVPGAAAGGDGPWHERRGFISVGRLHEYSEGIIHRHEQTHSGPKADRLNLLRATRTHFGQLFMLYSDPEKSIEKLLEPGRTADMEVTDEYGVLHLVWKFSDPTVIAAVAAVMSGRKLVIADGHHRYETALAYRNERRLQAGGAPDPSAAYERVMMTCINMEDPGLVILPTHRVIFGLDGFDASVALQRVRKYFRVTPLGEGLDARTALSRLAQADRDENIMVAAFSGGMFLLTPLPGAAESLLGDLSPRQRALDVVQLHKVLLQGVFQISEEAIRNLRHIRYIRDAAEALAQVREGANAAFLMNPVPVQEMRDVAFAGEVMPQKSTDFYPKLLSGLTMYAVD